MRLKGNSRFWAWIKSFTERKFRGAGSARVLVGKIRVLPGSRTVVVVRSDLPTGVQRSAASSASRRPEIARAALGSPHVWRPSSDQSIENGHSLPNSNARVFPSGRFES
jgi:hypothetical protein